MTGPVSIPAPHVDDRETARFEYWTGHGLPDAFVNDRELAERTYYGAYGFYDSGCVGSAELLVPTKDLDDAKHRARAALNHGVLRRPVGGELRPERATPYALGWLAGVALLFCCGGASASVECAECERETTSTNRCVVCGAEPLCPYCIGSREHDCVRSGEVDG